MAGISQQPGCLSKTENQKDPTKYQGNYSKSVTVRSCSNQSSKPHWPSLWIATARFLAHNDVSCVMMQSCGDDDDTDDDDDDDDGDDDDDTDDDDFDNDDNDDDGDDGDCGADDDDDDDDVDGDDDDRDDDDDAVKVAPTQDQVGLVEVAHVKPNLRPNMPTWRHVGPQLGSSTAQLKAKDGPSRLWLGQVCPLLSSLSNSH